MEWLFDGLGTMLIGVILGGGAGGYAGWRLGVRNITQTQKAGKKSRQTQVGGDYFRDRGH